MPEDRANKGGVRIIREPGEYALSWGSLNPDLPTDRCQGVSGGGRWGMNTCRRPTFAEAVKKQAELLGESWPPEGMWTGEWVKGTRDRIKELEAENVDSKEQCLRHGTALLAQLGVQNRHGNVLRDRIDELESELRLEKKCNEHSEDLEKLIICDSDPPGAGLGTQFQRERIKELEAENKYADLRVCDFGAKNRELALELSKVRREKGAMGDERKALQDRIDELEAENERMREALAQRPKGENPLARRIKALQAELDAVCAQYQRDVLDAES